MQEKIFASLFSAAEYSLFCRALLQKRLIMLRSLLIAGKLYASLFSAAEYSLFCRALLQKRLVMLRSLLIAGKLYASMLSARWKEKRVCEEECGM